MLLHRPIELARLIGHLRTRALELPPRSQVAKPQIDLGFPFACFINLSCCLDSRYVDDGEPAGACRAIVPALGFAEGANYGDRTGRQDVRDFSHGAAWHSLQRIDRVVRSD
jgi:hypothetical protein